MKLYQDMFMGGGALTAELIEAFLKYRKSKQDKELETPEWKALEKAYNDHLKWRFRYPSKIFGQQLAAGWIITVLVLALVIRGLTFSFLQLYTSIKVGDLSSLQTELAVQTAGKVSISSSIVGAIVLVISLAFFYLYLKHVFHIQYPIPPHVGLSDTDASKIYSHLKDEPPPELLNELDQLRTRYNYYGPVVSLKEHGVKSKEGKTESKKEGNKQLTK